MKTPNSTPPSIVQAKNIQKLSQIYTYRKLNLTNYPKHFKNLSNFAWKIIIWIECLIEFKAITYFDTSIWFTNSSKLAIEKFIFMNDQRQYNLSSKSSNLSDRSDANKSNFRGFDQDFLYFIKTAGHDIASHTHPTMYSYFPSNYMAHYGIRISGVGIKMHMAGAVIIYHTDRLKNNILKWALLCALTEDCISPPGSSKGCGRQNRYLYKQNAYEKSNYLPFLNEKNLMKFLCRNETCENTFKFRNDVPISHSICHRFDQALLSILMANYKEYSFTRNQIEDWNDWYEKFAYVQRSGEFSLRYDNVSRRVIRDKHMPVILTTEEENNMRNANPWE